MENIFKNKKVDFKRITEYGFVLKDNAYVYCAQNDTLQFLIKIFVAQDGSVATKCFDQNTAEEYTVYHDENANGAFVGLVRTAIDELLQDISDKCYSNAMFKFKQTNELIDKIRFKFGDELEFLWDNYDGGIWRRKDSKKWYALLQKIKRKALFHDNNDDLIEIIDIRAETAEIDRLVDDKLYFRGYHMNKKHWLTVILDGSIPTDELMQRIENSYELAKK